MADLIERSAAIDALDEIEAEVADGYGYQYAKWREYFAKMPAVDAVPVVRCKDCRHLIGAGMLEYCDFGTPHPNGFCSYGERKDGKEAE